MAKTKKETAEDTVNDCHKCVYCVQIADKDDKEKDTCCFHQKMSFEKDMSKVCDFFTLEIPH